jgi:hypothetical protein
MRSLVVLLALLLYWKLSHNIPELHAQAEAFAWCRRNGNFDALTDAMRDSTKRCASLLAAQYGRPYELQSFVAAAAHWLIDFARRLTTGT